MKEWPQYYDVLTKNIGEIYGILPLITYFLILNYIRILLSLYIHWHKLKYYLQHVKKMKSTEIQNLSKRALSQCLFLNTLYITIIFKTFS